MAKSLYNTFGSTLREGRVCGKLTKYLVSDDGRVFRYVQKIQKYKYPVRISKYIIDSRDYYPGMPNVELEEIICKPNKTTKYLQLNVPFRDGTHTTVQLGRLILESFSTPPEDMVKPQADHLDFNVTNNKLSNLRWLEAHDNNVRHRNKRIK